MTGFYNGDNFLKWKDKNGKDPELFIVCSRVRGPGKTFYFANKLITDYLQNHAKFVLFTRYNKELGGIAEGVLKDVLAVKLAGYSVVEKVKMKGTFSEIMLVPPNSDQKSMHVGYVIPLNAADTIKRIAKTFSDAQQGYFDEFLSERDKYLPEEVEDFLRVHGSLVKGSNTARRYFPVYMTSNTVTVLNPYFEKLGLTKSLQANTKKYKGDGFVYQRIDNEGIAAQHAEGGINRAFRSVDLIDYSSDEWMLDDKTGICKTDGLGNSIYIATLIDGDKGYSVRYYFSRSIYYLSESYDKSDPRVFNLSIDGSDNPYISTTNIARVIRDAIKQGRMRFENLNCKRIALEVLC